MNAWRKRPFVDYQYEGDISEYTERGVKTGAKITNDHLVEGTDINRIYSATKQMDLKGSFKWIAANEQSFEDSTVIVNTDDGDALESLKRLHPFVIINKRGLNKIRHLNTFLNRANEVLDDGGYLWCHSRTAVLKKTVIIEHYPKYIGHLIYFTHYLWHRVAPKLDLTRWLYFKVTGGKNRTYNRVEILGRMYRAGFEVIDEEFRYGEYFVLGRKMKAPIWDDEPSCGPLIKLRRVGKDGNIIGVYKFRTMFSYSEYLQPYIYAHEGLQDGGKFNDDYRVNTVGKFMRRTWLDELPMIINLFKGQLKLVGVRPLSRHYFSLYTPEMQQLRITVKPGLFPPFYYEKETPRTIEEVQESERRYIEAYHEHPFRTDCRYFFGSIWNIVVRHKRSH